MTIIDSTGADSTGAAAPQFDSGPLSWVMVEIREALARSKTALFEAGGRDREERATALQHAQSHLHQAHGALLMVDIDGVCLLTEAAERALGRFKDGSLEYHVEHAQVLAEVYQALVEYLEALLAGAPAQPVRLFPYYRALQQLLGAERIHPADLFFAPAVADAPGADAPGADEMASGAANGDAVAPDAAQPDYPAWRQRFEKALLPFLKSGDPASRAGHAGALLEAVTLVAEAQQAPPARRFWLALRGFAELVAAGQLDNSLYVKQLFGLINLQMRRLSQGDTALPAAMLHDALFFIAAAGEPTPVASKVRRAHRLDGLVPPDFERKRYGQVDPDALAAAQQGLARAKAGWSRLAGADVELDAALSAELGSAFADALAQVAAAGDKLKVPALGTLMRHLGEVAVSAARSGRDRELGLEMAGALLFAEHGLEQIRRLPDDFAGNAATIVARLDALAAGTAPPAPAQWQSDLSRQIEQDQTVAVLAAEMKSALRQAEKVLDDFHAGTVSRAALAQAEPLLHQLQGALAVLDQEHAMRAAGHIQQAVQQLAAGGDGADDARALDPIAQNIGALGFFVDMLGRNVDAARARFQFDEAAGTFRAIPFEKMAAADPVPLLEEALAPTPPVAPPSAPPALAGDAAIEAELLDIFLSEARDELAFVGAALAVLRGQAGSADQMALLRRAFHTLKGSARMVGLTEFAAAAGAIENVMNVWLAEARAPDGALFALLEYACAEMSVWIAELAAGGASTRSGAALVEAAGRVRDGAAFDVAQTAPDAPPEDAQSAATPDTPSGAAPAGQAGERPQATQTPQEVPAEPEEPDEVAEPGEPAETTGSAVPDGVAAPNRATVIDFPAVPAPLPDDHLKHVGELVISLPLYTIYLAETDELLRVLTRDFSEWHHEPLRPVSAEALQAAHTLTGTSGTVGFKSLRDLALALEQAIASAALPAPALDAAQRALLDRSVERIGHMLRAFALGELAPAEVQLIRELHDLRAQLSAPVAAAPANGSGLDDLETHLQQLFAQAYAGIVGAATPAAVAAVAATAPAPASAAPAAVPVATVPAVPVSAPASAPAALPAPSDSDDPALSLEALFADAYASLAGKAPPSATTPQAATREPASEPASAKPARAPAPDTSDVDELFDAIFDEAFTAPPAMPPTSPPLPAAASGSADQAGAGEAAPGLAAVGDDIDPDLLPVFLEEGADLLPQIGQALRAWQRQPRDLGQAQMLLRSLHTVKGSARMAGAIRLGQHAHEIETHIENMLHAGSTPPQAFEELLVHYDHAQMLFELLQQADLGPVAVAGPDPDLQPAVAEVAAAPGPAVPAAGEPEDASAPRVALVRVRADLLDNLVNQAGEVSIARSKLENEVGAQRAALLDFSDNLARLRRQLREVEMQAESQIASRMAISSEREFDPLEFDRFTRLQELTRMMAESVNDVASFHENLSRSVDNASADLVQQARLTRDLQRDLMRVRMVPFSSIAERLFRVARQSAKQVDKRVNLDIRGGAVELDRSVLERMAAPFEHLLRNAIAHGIEPRATRGASGKSEAGELLVQVSQQGNEVVIEFSDDGAGFDLERIRAKARSGGLLAADQDITDQQAAQLIFEAGLSTADSVSTLAGRGVGLDIVRAEVHALGGHVDIASEPGQGAHFAIHLPLTLAVTQVVLLACGGKTYALPSTQVEQVRQVKQATLAAAHAAGTWTAPGQPPLALHYLAALLGDAGARPVDHRSSPVLILKSGNERLALQVDEVLGNREVVIKNIGPQLERMAGIAGATVLGSGEIVLILNPVALARHLEQHPELRPRYAQAAGASADAAIRAPQTLIMVVDDSLTVRRVTERLLEREGYRVALAKDGVDALEQLQGVTPSLMLVDIEMPRMDGFDLTRNVRGDARTRAIPIIMITSRSADKHRKHALELGVDAYFGKPFQEDALLAQIAALLRR